MFENLTSRLNEVFTQLRRRAKLSAADVDAMLREVRLALREADVNYGVVKEFTGRVRERAVGAEVSKALNPAQQVIKIVNEELIATLGETQKLNLSGVKPFAVMLVGLQGAGKTTAAAKLARKLRSEGERVLLVAADPYRPAAVKQLQTLGEKIGVDGQVDGFSASMNIVRWAVIHVFRPLYLHPCYPTAVTRRRQDAPPLEHRLGGATRAAGPTAGRIGEARPAIA
jgi:signal recognition particle GTPase